MRDGDSKLEDIDEEQEALIQVPLRTLSTVGSATSGSVASRIAQRRREMASERAEARKNSIAAAATTEPTGGSSDSKPAAVSFTFVWMNSAALAERKAEKEAEASSFAGGSSDNCRTKLGRYLIDQSVSVEALAAEWDRNKDGDLSRAEFRINVKKLNLGIEISDIDALFDTFDGDHSGSLEIPELKTALKAMKEEVRRSMELGDHGKDVAVGLQAVVAAYEVAHAETLAFEQIEANLEAIRSGQSTTSRLGALLKTRNLKVGDVVRSWDKNGDGQFDITEWRTNIRGLGFKATDAEIDAVFHDLDEDGSGELDLDEVKVALKKVQDAATQWLQQEAAVVKQLSQAKKAAKAAQHAAQKAEAEEKAEHARKDEEFAAAKAAEKAAAAAKAAKEREEARQKKEQMEEKNRKQAMMSR